MVFSHLEYQFYILMFQLRYRSDHKCQVLFRFADCGRYDFRISVAKTIANLLRKEYGDSHRSIKQLISQTDASERTVKHWLLAQHAPDTLFFLRLVVSSPVIRAFVLGLIEEPASDPLSIEGDRLTRAAAREAHVAGEAAFGALAKDAWENDPDRDPINDPEPIELNDRQHWFLVVDPAPKKIMLT